MTRNTVVHRLALWQLVGLMTVSCQVLAAQRGTRPAGQLEAPVAQQIYREKIALVIGINDYQAFDPLRFATGDAQTIRDILVEQFAFDHVELMLDEDASRASVLAKIFEIGERLSEDDQFFFYFAGHGISYGDDESRVGYLVPQDVSSVDARDIISEGISMVDLLGHIDRFRARHVLLVIDSCFGGLASQVRREGSPSGPNTRARQIITAGRKNQKVIDGTEWGHSALALAMIRVLGHGEAVDGKETITVSDLFAYLRPSVMDWTRNQQEPVLSRFSRGEGEFTFFLEGELKKPLNPARITSLLSLGTSADISPEALKLIRPKAQEVIRTLAEKLPFLVESRDTPLVNRLGDRSGLKFEDAMRVLPPLRDELDTDGIHLTWLKPPWDGEPTEIISLLYCPGGIQIGESRVVMNYERQSIEMKDGVLETAELIKSLETAARRNFSRIVQGSRCFGSPMEDVLRWAEGGRPMVHVLYLPFADAVFKDRLPENEGEAFAEAIEGLIDTNRAKNQGMHIIRIPSETLGYGDHERYPKLFKVLLSPRLDERRKRQVRNDVVARFMGPRGVDILITGMLIPSNRSIEIQLIAVSRFSDQIRSKSLRFADRRDILQPVGSIDGLRLTPEVFEEIQSFIADSLKLSGLVSPKNLSTGRQSAPTLP